MLEALLAQQRWRRARRGRWHDRRALVLMFHLHEEDRAMKAVVEALTDPDTHIGTSSCLLCVGVRSWQCSDVDLRSPVFRPSLVQRLTRLEKRLKIPPEARHVCEGSLQIATQVSIEGVRIRHRAGSLLLNQAGRVVNHVPDGVKTLSWSNRVEASPAKKAKVEVGGTVATLRG